MIQVIEIWQESFGDSREDIEKFFFYCAENLRVCVHMEDERVTGFLCLLSATLNLKGVPERQALHNSAEYIYAVATKKEYRNKGVSTELLEYVRAILLEEHKCGILVPADESLEQFYKKRGFSCCFVKTILQVTHADSNPCEKHSSPAFQKFKDITVSAYLDLRKKTLQNISHLSLADEVVAYAVESILSEGFRLSSISVGEKEYAFLYWEQTDEPNNLFIQETTAIGKEDITFAVTMLLDTLGKSTAEVRISYPTYGILLPPSPPYEGRFNLVLD